MSQIDKHLNNNQKGNLDELRKDAVDPSYVPDPNDPNKSKFLVWTKIKTGTGKETYQATGFDGKVYTIEEDAEPVVKPSTVKIESTQPIPDDTIESEKIKDKTK